jgi:serine protease Do
VHNPLNTAISFILLITVVGGSFYYVHATDPIDPYLGLRGREVTPDIAQQLGVQEARGLLIVIVDPGSPADQAGLRAGNIITSIDNKAIIGADDAEAILAPKEVGDTVKFTIIRDNTTQEVNVVVGGR